MNIALIILVRNERPCLEVVLPHLPAAGSESGYDQVWAVDGGSIDGSQELLESHGIKVIGQTRRGRGEAFHLAVREIPADAFIFFSPDGNEEIGDLPRFRPLLEQGADIVIASRMMKGAINEEDSQFFRWRKWANSAFNVMANVAFRRKGPFITDSINGYRATTKAIFDSLGLNALDYTIEYQMTIRAFKHRLRIVEFPTYEGERIAGESGAPSFPTGLRFIGRFISELCA